MIFKAKPEEIGIRLDIWLNRHLPGLSRSRIQNLIRAGHVMVDGHRTRAHCRVQENLEAVVNVPEPVPTSLVAEDIPLAVLHEDPYIIVLNKPAGLVVHPASGHWSGTLANALLSHCSDLAGIGGEMRPGIVHRLDRDTTGVMVVAKNDKAMDVLAKQFRKGMIHKEYLALVHGVPEPPEGRIETLIGRSRVDRKKMSTRPATGKNAITNYAVVQSSGLCSLVRLRIETGRTHQIRVHMAYLGHPVVGDQKYGKKKRPVLAKSDENNELVELLFSIPRQMLHAECLAFQHPVDNAPVEFRAPLPSDMAELMSRLKMPVGAAGEGKNRETGRR